MRFFSRIVVLISLLLCLIPVSAQSSIASLIDLVNQARIAQGVAPLAGSSVLTTVAQGHSNDMAKTQTLSHTGSDGSEFWERMQSGGYALTTGAENVLVRADTDGTAAFEQWKSSPSHLANMLNPAYHEIGIASTQAFNGSYYYTMVLGARIDSTPQPFASATATNLPTLIPTGTALASNSVTSEPTRAIEVVQPSAITLLPSATPTIDAIQIATIAESTRVIETAPTSVTATLEPTRVIEESPTPIVVPTETFISDAPQILLSYTPDSITLINIAPEPMDVSKLIFSSENGSFAARRWREFGANMLNALAPGDCLQIWTTETKTLPEPPATCTIQQAWLAVGPTGQFWRDTETFTVQNESQTIAQCEIADGACSFALFEEAIPIIGVTPSVPVDVQLIVDTNGVTLINVSGRNLNLSNLTFVGGDHTFNAQRWNTLSLSRPLHQFPSGDCLQVWAFGDTSNPMTPTECGLRHGWILVPPGEQFWSEVETFIVLNNNISVGTCSTANRVCNLNIP